MTIPTCPGCSRVECQCELLEQVRGCHKREAEAVAEAYRYRELWEAAAACLQHNRKRIKPRGEDERLMLEAADRCLCGHFWSGKTSGWMDDDGVSNG